MAISISGVRIPAAGTAEGRRHGAAAAAALLPPAPEQRRLFFSGRAGPAKRAGGLRAVRSAPATPGGISEKKISESIKEAEEACAGDAGSGECAAAWDVVEEISAAAGHARDRAKESDPLENYCKDNPEADECRTYED